MRRFVGCTLGWIQRGEVSTEVPLGEASAVTRGKFRTLLVPHSEELRAYR